jgi:CheY-like chemotaxis protein
MNGLQDFLTPFSHLIFANRDKVIVALALLLALFTVQLLITRWRNERLERDLAAAKSAPTSHGGRRYATNTPVEEPPVESGALPPVKGGRTYARNLGTALQKAGIAGPQIYSPPPPPGWAPNTNPPQQGVGQPGPGGSPYAPQNAPWAAPAAPPPSPWGFPGGAGRGMPGPMPNQAPYYQPQPVPQQPPQPPAPPAGAPGFYGPPAGPMFGQPAFPSATSGPTPAPNFASQAPPMASPVAPAFGGNPPAVEPPAAEPSAGDGGRRGKPKRRRFNFNVLENLEKMVQLRTAEPLPPMGWTPPVAPAAPTAAAAPSLPTLAPTPEPTATVRPALTPAPEPMPEPVKGPPTEAESLPLQFEAPVQAEAEAQVQAEAQIEAEAQPEKDTTASVEQEVEPSVVAEVPLAEPEREPEPEPEPAPAPEPRRGPRGSMRAMLFGEESTPKDEVPAPAVPTVSKPEPAPEAEPVGEPVAEPEPVVAEQVADETAPEAEPVTEAFEPQSWEAWRSARDSEAERQSEAATVHAETESVADFGGTPGVDGGDRPSAGTVVIIEDDATAASYYATLFRGNGYRVEVANDGVSGVDLCTRLQPQLILLDVMMPRQNGILVLQTLRASDETKNTPVVVMSNFSEPTLIKRAIQLGALEYVIKTQVEGPALLNALPRWINHEKAFAAA